MGRDTPEGRLLTEYEGALDSFHQSLPLWDRPRPEARFALLAAFDLLNAVVPLGLITSAPHPHAVQQIKWLHDNLIYATQFFWRAERSTRVSVPVHPDVLAEAAAFLMHCKEYAILTDFHVGLGRGLYTLDADPRRRRIRFVPAPAPGAAPDPLGFWRSTTRGGIG